MFRVGLQVKFYKVRHKCESKQKISIFAEIFWRNRNFDFISVFRKFRFEIFFVGNTGLELEICQMIFPMGFANSVDTYSQIKSNRSGPYNFDTFFENIFYMDKDAILNVYFKKSLISQLLLGIFQKKNCIEFPEISRNLYKKVC